MAGTFNPPTLTGATKRTTDNYGFIIPVFDAPGWGIAVEANFDVIDSVLFTVTGIANVRGIWTNSTLYEASDRAVDTSNNSLWQCLVDHTSASSGTFAEDRAANPSYWREVSNGAVPRGDWAPATNYNSGEFVTDSGRTGIITRRYTSGASYNADVANGDIITIVDTAAFQDFAAATVVADPKTTLHVDDLLALIDSEDGDALKQVSVADLYANVDTYLQGTYSWLATTTAAYTSAEKSKLSGIEAGADVTDASGVGTAINSTSELSSTDLADGDTVGVLDASDGTSLKKFTLLSLLGWFMNKLGLHGVVVDYAGSTAPTYWLLCYGQEVSRTTYAALFAKIGTTYGVGDGSTTFNLPDCRGRVVAGKDNMGGTSANRLTGLSGGLDGDVLGATGGAETHTLDITQIPPHQHTGTTGTESNDHTHTTSMSFNARFGANGSGIPEADWGSGDSIKGVASRNVVSGGRSTSHTHNFTSNSTGGGNAHNNVQPTIVFNKLIFTGVA